MTTRILALAYDYRPRLGGVATCAFELLQALNSVPGVEVRLIAPASVEAESFDQTSDLDVLRVALPETAAQAVVPLSTHLSKELLAWKPTAVLDFLWIPEGLASLMALPLMKVVGADYFVFAHAVELVETRRNLRKRVRAALGPLKASVANHAAAVFAVSRFTQKLVEDYCRLSPDKIQLVFNGVDPGKFYPEPPAEDLVRKHGLEGKKVFLTVSRLVDYKGLDRAIAALRSVVARNKDVAYLICGEGKDLGRLQALARHYRVQEHVIFAGAVPFSRLRDYYNLADAFVLLSREDWEEPNLEGFGIVFLEAAACGKPSIAGRSGGSEDAVGSEATGWLVDPLDDEAISRAMIEAIETPGEAKKRGEAARARAIGEYTWDKMAQRVLERIQLTRTRRPRVRN